MRAQARALKAAGEFQDRSLEANNGIHYTAQTSNPVPRRGPGRCWIFDANTCVTEMPSPGRVMLATRRAWLRAGWIRLRRIMAKMLAGNSKHFRLRLWLPEHWHPSSARG